MSTDGKFMLLIGESFVDVGEEYATECKVPHQTDYGCVRRHIICLSFCPPTDCEKKLKVCQTQRHCCALVPCVNGVFVYML
jgi:hypothetical protein